MIRDIQRPNTELRREELRDVLTIGQLSRRYGLTLRTIRFYESRGLIHPIRVGTTRFFDQPTCHRLELIQRGKRMGMTLTEIEMALARDTEFESTFLEMPVGEVERRINELEQQRDGLDAAIVDLYEILAKSRPAHPSPAGGLSTSIDQHVRLMSGRKF